MASSDYAPEEYDFFLRNCNHFCVDLAERLAGPFSAEDAKFMEEIVLHESEAILNNLPGGAFQQSMTRGVTRQVQKIIIKSWRKEWKRALAEYEVENNIPVAQRISKEEDLTPRVRERTMYGRVGAVYRACESRISLKIERGPATRRLPALATEPQRKHNREGRSVAPSSIGPKERMSRRGGLRLRASEVAARAASRARALDPSADNYNRALPELGSHLHPGAHPSPVETTEPTNFDSTAGPCRAPRTGLAHTSGAAGHLGCPVDRLRRRSVLCARTHMPQQHTRRKLSSSQYPVAAGR